MCKSNDLLMVGAMICVDFVVFHSRSRDKDLLLLLLLPLPLLDQLASTVVSGVPNIRLDVAEQI